MKKNFYIILFFYLFISPANAKIVYMFVNFTWWTNGCYSPRARTSGGRGVVRVQAICLEPASEPCCAHSFQQDFKIDPDAETTPNACGHQTIVRVSGHFGNFFRYLHFQNTIPNLHKTNKSKISEDMSTVSPHC